MTDPYEEAKTATLAEKMVAAVAVIITKFPDEYADALILAKTISKERKQDDLE